MENGKTPLVLPFEEPGTAERRRRGEERREEEAVATPGILLPVPVFAERNVRASKSFFPPRLIILHRIDHR